LFSIGIPKMARKQSVSNSASSAVKAMFDAAKGPPLVPDHVMLRAGDEPFWDGVIRARAYDEWTGPDLVMAVQLARAQADIEREQVLLDAEGSVIENNKGTPIANPRFAVLENLGRREMALMRSLRMAGKDGGDVRQDIGRRKIQREAERVREDLADDELLAT
jgi:hypothetical protein